MRRPWCRCAGGVPFLILYNLLDRVTLRGNEPLMNLAGTMPEKVKELSAKWN
jgi:hypothetical protein